MNPPDWALVLCVDEKSQIQALDRTQPGPPLRKGRGGDDDLRLQAQRHHDAVRRSTGRRALSSASAIPITVRKRSSGSSSASTSVCRGISISTSSSTTTGRTPAVKRWLAKHRCHLHFTPTSASWLNLVERFFAEITQKRTRRGTFTSVAEVNKPSAIISTATMPTRNPFVWTKTAEKERRALDRLEAIKVGNQACESEQWRWKLCGHVAICSNNTAATEPQLASVHTRNKRQFELGAGVTISPARWAS
jgi:hypothetical protein